MELLFHLQHASPFPFHPAHSWSLPSLLINPFIVYVQNSAWTSHPQNLNQRKVVLRLYTIWHYLCYGLTLFRSSFNPLAPDNPTDALGRTGERGGSESGCEAGLDAVEMTQQKGACWGACIAPSLDGFLRVFTTTTPSDLL